MQCQAGSHARGRLAFPLRPTDLLLTPKSKPGCNRTDSKSIQDSRLQPKGSHALAQSSTVVPQTHPSSHVTIKTTFAH